MSEERMVQGIEHLGRHFVQVIKTELEVDLEYDAAAVHTLDAYIEQIRGNYTAETVPTGLVQSIGAFLGACIIAAYGGRWGQESETSDWGIALPVRDGEIWVFPFNKVYKHFVSGPENSVHVFYTAIQTLLDPERDWLEPSSG
ncbi:MAG: hypothetical protein H0T53_00315 [Herpetosiphonaceae bacterium]|nr:hypothetical protein [Herpetosiphonaceae bacterium]